MTTINLHQISKDETNGFSIKNSSGLIFSIGMVIVVILGVVGLKYYAPKAQEANDRLSAEIKVENDKIVGLKSLEQVVDMQARTAEIKKNLEINDKGEISRTVVTKVLDDLGLELSKGIIVSNLKYETDKLTISFEAMSFGDAAKQIFTFKNSKNFEKVNLLNISRKELAVIASVEMTIKKTEVLEKNDQIK